MNKDTFILKTKYSAVISKLSDKQAGVSDEELTSTEESLKREIDRGKAMESIAKEIIEIGRLQVEREKLVLKAVNDGLINADQVNYKSNLIEMSK